MSTTPLKALSTVLSPKVLSSSPLSSSSPLLALRNCRKNVRSPTVTKFKELSPFAQNRQVVKQLEFAQGIRIHVTTDDCQPASTKDLQLNTPIKKQLMKTGDINRQLVKILGKGAFGMVIRGVYKGDTVAVKVVKTANVSNERNAVHLKHVNVTETIDIIANDQHDYSLVFMEYCPNSRQLQALLDDVTVQFNEVDLALDISRGLQFCHSHNVLHLDVKPCNILVCQQNPSSRLICKLCDFGNSLCISNDAQYTHRGTAMYTAPEILQGDSPTAKSDVYSLGIVLWQIKSRRYPYRGFDNKQTIIYKVVKCGLRPNNCEDSSADADEFSRLACECWSKEPANRPDLSTVIERLERARRFSCHQVDD